MMNAAAVFDLDRELTGPAGDPNTSFAAADIAKNQIIIFIVNIQLKLGVAIAAKREQRLSKIFTSLEKIWDEYHVYEKQEGGNGL